MLTTYKLEWRVVITVVAAIMMIAAMPAQAQRATATSGQIQGISAPVSVTRDGLKSDRFIMAFQERQRVALSKPVLVNVSRPGKYAVAKSNTNGTIPAGTVVNSCLLESNTASNKVLSYDASVTFDANILGIIVGSLRLNDTDAVLGTPTTTYPFHDAFRGLEQDGTKNGDWVMLSGDRHTVTVHFATGSAVDEIRIITAD